ncbi:methionyl-tRNA formyltransferase [Gammaproteobacteria bacterium]|jgi:methionyl-tRNA formyltransferase|nr:methionyl-tRNA formyltransferase [Gammaproteobacteria bacterium]
MNILFAGTPYPSGKILEYLASSSAYKVKGVITQPDKPQKRGNKILQSSVSKISQNYGFPVFKPTNLNDPDFIKNIEGIDFDFLVVAAYGKIIPNWLLNAPNKMPINIHYSILPSYRGASPIQTSLLNGDNISGVTFMEMSEGLDEGKIIKVFTLDIIETHNKTSLENDLCDLAIKNMDDVFGLVFSNKILLNAQDDASASYCSKIKKSDSIINFAENAYEIINKYRAYSEWPGLAFMHKDVMVKIHGMDLYHEDLPGTSGAIVRFDKTGIYFKTGSGTIVITYLQLPNKNKISSADAYNSYREFFV